MSETITHREIVKGFIPFFIMRHTKIKKVSGEFWILFPKLHGLMTERYIIMADGDIEFENSLPLEVQTTLRRQIWGVHTAFKESGGKIHGLYTTKTR